MYYSFTDHPLIKWISLIVYILHIVAFCIIYGKEFLVVIPEKSPIPTVNWYLCSNRFWTTCRDCWDPDLSPSLWWFRKDNRTNTMKEGINNESEQLTVCLAQQCKYSYYTKVCFRLELSSFYHSATVPPFCFCTFLHLSDVHCTLNMAQNNSFVLSVNIWMISHTHYPVIKQR